MVNHFGAVDLRPLRDVKNHIMYLLNRDDFTHETLENDELLK